MQLLKISAALGALSLASLVHASAYLECGSIACPGNEPFSTAVTGVNDLTVGGEHFDVGFTRSQPTSSPFVFSSAAAAPGQPLTGIDAGNAISAFYGALQPPYAGGYSIAGDPGPAFITGFAPSGASSAAYFGATELWDVAQTSVGGGAVQTQVFGSNGFNSSNQMISDNNGDEVYYTRWTVISAPEMDPSVAGGAMALLLGGLTVLRGRRAHRLARQGSAGKTDFTA